MLTLAIVFLLFFVLAAPTTSVCKERGRRRRAQLCARRQRPHADSM